MGTSLGGSGVISQLSSHEGFTGSCGNEIVAIGSWASVTRDEIEYVYHASRALKQASHVLREVMHDDDDDDTRVLDCVLLFIYFLSLFS